MSSTAPLPQRVSAEKWPVYPGVRGYSASKFFTALLCGLAILASAYCPGGYAKDLIFKNCLTLLGAGMYNQYLETYCGFKGGVGAKLRGMYRVGGCETAVPQAVVDEMAKKVTEDSASRKNAMGEQTFCEGNERA